MPNDFMHRIKKEKELTKSNEINPRNMTAELRQERR